MQQAHCRRGEHFAEHLCASRQLCSTTYVLSHGYALHVIQTVKELIEKVKANGNKDVTLYMYPGEGHGFMNGGQDIHKMMKSKSSYPLSVMPVCVIAQQQNLNLC